MSATTVRRRRTAVALVSALAALALTVPFPTGSAQAASTPPFRLGAVECLSGGLMRAYPPPVMRSVSGSINHRNPELVKWSPDLQIYTRSGWRNYDTSRPFYLAFTTPFGYSNTMYGQGWYNNNGQVSFVPFYGLRRGYYRIRNWLYWDALGRTYHAAGGQCRFT